MAGIDIANKVKSGLNKASVKTGDGTSTIYLNKKVYSAGGSPLSPPTETVTPILLVDAITKNIDKKLIDNDLILGGDINLVSNGDVEIVQNDEIDINGKIYAVIAVDVKKPSNVPLAYISQLRAQ
jgi:hypothetical protein